MKSIDSLQKNSSHAYAKYKLILEWNHNRFNKTNGMAGRPISYRAPLYNKEYPVYKGADNQTFPLNPANGEMLVDASGFVLDSLGDRVPYVRSDLGKRAGGTTDVKNYCKGSSSPVNGAIVRNGIVEDGQTWTVIRPTNPSQWLRYFVDPKDVKDGSTYSASVYVKNTGASSITVTLGFCNTTGQSVVVAPSQRAIVSAKGVSKVTAGTAYRPIDVKVSGSGALLVTYPTLTLGNLQGAFNATGGVDSLGNTTGDIYRYTTENGFAIRFSNMRFMKANEAKLAICDDGVSTLDEDGRELIFSKKGTPVSVNENGELNTVVVSNRNVVADKNFVPVQEANGDFITLAEMDLTKKIPPVDVANKPVDSTGNVVPLDMNNSYTTRNYDEKLFPIKSLVSSYRPKNRGIKYGWASAAGAPNYYFTGQQMPDSWVAESGKEGRFYAVSQDAKYKYWVSPNESWVTPYNEGSPAYSNEFTSLAGWGSYNSNIVLAGGTLRATSTESTKSFGAYSNIQMRPKGNAVYRFTANVKPKQTGNIMLGISQYSKADTNYQKTDAQGYLGLTIVSMTSLTAGVNGVVSGGIVLDPSTAALQIGVYMPSISRKTATDSFDVDSVSLQAVGFPINARPTVEYAMPMLTNKLVFGIDYTLPPEKATIIQKNSGVLTKAPHTQEPLSGSVEIVYDRGDGVSAVKTMPLPYIDENGKSTVYIKGIKNAQGYVTDIAYSKRSESKESFIQEGTGVYVSEISYAVYRMTQPGQRFEINEISARLEYDMSKYLISWDSNADMADVSFFAPFGKISSNTGNIELDNSDGRFFNNNESLTMIDSRGEWVSSGKDNPYTYMLGPGVSVLLDASLTEKYTDVPQEWERMMTMETTADWKATETVRVGLKDDSTQLQTIKPNKMMVGQGAFFKGRLSSIDAIRFLLDSVGYTNIDTSNVVNDSSVNMKFFWTTGDKTVWECLSELCEHLQIAAYFDEYNVLKFETMGTLKTKARSRYPSALLTGEDIAYRNGDKAYANMEKPSVGRIFEVNRVNVKYKTVASSDEEYGIPKMEEVWSPEGTVTLRAASLTAPMDINSRTLRMSESDAQSWPFVGKMQIEAELIEYDGKQYLYYDKDGKIKYVYLKSQKSKDAYDDMNTSLSYKNKYTGVFAISKRGAENTKIGPHGINLGLTVYSRTDSGQLTRAQAALTTNIAEGAASLYGNTTCKPSTYLTAVRGRQADTQPPKVLATRMKFTNDKYSVGSGGLVLGHGPNQSGIFVELSTTEHTVASKRVSFNEVSIVTKAANGQRKRWSSGVNIQGKGSAQQIDKNRWYDLMVTNVKRPDGGYSLGVYLNGNIVLSVNLSPANIPFYNGARTIGGECGVFVRGNSKALFEYLYSAENTAYDDYADRASINDRASGSLWPLRYMLEMYSMAERGKQYYFNEFVPIVHETRTYEVDFKDSIPSEHSALFTSNEKAYCTEYRHSSFGAVFTVVNGARENVILNGEDEITYGPDNSVNQKMMVYGRRLNIGEEATISSANGISTRMEGEKALDINSPWVQSETVANQLAYSITNSWKNGSSDLEAAIFPNLRLSIGDVVSVYLPDAGIGDKLLVPTVEAVAANNRYVVNSIKRSGDSDGFTMSVNARAMILDNTTPTALSTEYYNVTGNIVYNPNMKNVNDWNVYGWSTGPDVTASPKAGALFLQGVHEKENAPVSNAGCTLSPNLIKNNTSAAYYLTDLASLAGAATVSGAVVEDSRESIVTWVVVLETTAGVFVRDLSRKSYRLRPGQKADISFAVSSEDIKGKRIKTYFVLHDSDGQTATKNNMVYIDSVSILNS